MRFDLAMNFQTDGDDVVGERHALVLATGDKISTPEHKKKNLLPSGRSNHEKDEIKSDRGNFLSGTILEDRAPSQYSNALGPPAALRRR